MSTEPVKTGIDVIGAVPWGTHFCQFYQTKEDLLDTLVPYFKAGLENNEFCMWITAEPLSAQEAHKAMRRAVPDFADRLARGQIEILPHTKWYLEGGKFDQQRVLDGWVDKLNAALAAGYSGLRLTGNTFWLEKRDWKGFTDYEAAVNDVIGKYHMLALCTYSLDKCGAVEIMDVIRNHEFALVRREGKWEIIENAIHKQAKQAVLESERKYRQLMESLQEGVWVIDKDASTTFVNPRMAELLGYSVDEMLGKPLFSFVDESNLSVAKERMERRRRGMKEEVEFSFRRKDGSQVWALVSAAPLTDVRGDFSGVIAGIVDITGRKQMEEELRRRQTEIQALLDSSPAGLVLFDAAPPYTVLVHNRYYQELFAEPFRSQGMVGLNIYDYAPEVEAAGVAAVFEEVVRTKQAKSFLDFPYKSNPPEESWFNWHMSPIILDGKVVALVSMSIDVTESHRAELALRQSEEKYRLLFQNMAEGFALYELLYDEEGRPVDWRILEMNDAYTHHTGITREKILGRRISEVYPELLPEYLSRFAQVVATQVPVEFETYSKPAGRHMHVNTFPAGGHRFASAFEDITKRKQAERDLKETSDYLDNLLNHANAPIIVWDPELRITKFNRAFQRLTGHGESEAVGQRLDMLFPTHRREESLAHIHRAMAGERWETVEIPVLRVDGEVRTVLWNSANIVGSDGKTTVATIAQGQDITERKQAEDTLRETRDYLDNLLNYANAPIIVWDPELRITKFNRAFQNLTGYKESEVLGKQLDLLFPEESRDASLAHISRTAAGERWEVIEIPIRRADGMVRTVLWNSANVRGSDGETTEATIAQGQDITERKQSEVAIQNLNDALRQRAAELEVANKELESFAYSVSHDLRAPLRSIDGFSLALLEDYAGKLDDQGKDYLHRVRVASQVMGLLIDDMLELSRVSRADFHRRRVDLSGLAQEIAQELQDREPERCVDLVIASCLSVYGDAPLLRAALENLLSNAWKFTGKRGGAKIEFGTVKRDGERVYFVRDNGVGFDMNYADKLFEPFHRLHSKEEFPGTGIGLATVRRIINRHGGRIWAEGKVGNGATFYFTLSDSLGEK